MIFSPFPFKFISNSSTQEGSVYLIPKFCKSHRDDPKCKKFYLSLENKEGFFTCPFGFGIEKLTVGDRSIIFTCLNIEKISSRNEMRKLIKNDEFIPRLPLVEYKRIKHNFISFIDKNKDSFESMASQTQEVNELTLNRNVLDNTIHEIRKLNTQLKWFINRFSSHLNNLRGKTEVMENLGLDIYSIANLMSIRLDSYDLEVNPELNLKSGKRDIPIYRKIEKVYKCLGTLTRKKNIIIKLENNSHNSFSAHNIIEIGFFIVLENAIKYSPDNEIVIVRFNELSDRLLVTFRNWGPAPDSSEKKALTQRGFRSKAVEDLGIEGRGIGLYLLNQICAINEINLEIKIENENKFINGVRYSPFIVSMSFENMIVPEKE